MKVKKILLPIITLLFAASAVLGVCFATDVFVSSYTVTFDAGGGELEGETTIEVEKGATITFPLVSYEGHTLNGWYNDKELWTENKKVTRNMTLTARWDVEIHDITFVVDGKVYHEYVKHGEIPVFHGETTKESTETEEYSFIGWEPSLTKATKSTRYLAKFETDVRKYNVNLSLNLSGAGELSGAGKYEYSNNVEICITPNLGYKFLGWYHEDGSLFTTETNFNISNISADYNLIAKFELIKRNITYVDSKNAVNPNPKVYDVTYGTIALQNLTKTGYNFLGWYTSEEGGDKITLVNSEELQNKTFYARWELETYTISYNLYGGTNNPGNLNSYTIETPTFSLYEPTKEEDNFIGWSGTDLLITTKNVTINMGSTGDRTYSAVWTGAAKVITLVAGGIELSNDTIIANAGDSILAPLINGEEYGMQGYEVNNWKTADGEEFIFNKMPNENITLYGEFEYFLGSGFIPYKDKFDAATNTSYNSPLHIDSYSELVAFVEYSCFYNKSNIHIKPTYRSFSQNELKAEMSSAIQDSKYPNLGTIGYSTYSSGGIGYYDLSSSGKSNETNLIMADPTKAHIMEQPAYALSITLEAKRAADYDDFNINKVSSTLIVSSSNELVYALEIGLKPLPVSGSQAEIIYNKAKEILRDICIDSMTDIEKARAIYEYVTINVQYDNYAVSTYSIKNNWTQYDSWQAEGALLNGVAVCDGISKAYLILAKIENIPVVRVESEDHAWNKIYVRDAWYGVDATHADIVDSTNGIEVFTYTQFMFTDAFKEAAGNVANNYKNLQATTIYNYYDEVVIEASDCTYDLIIESPSEYLDFIEFIRLNVGGYEIYTFELVFTEELYSTTYLYTVLGATNVLMGTKTDSSGATVYAFIIYVS